MGSPRPRGPRGLHPRRGAGMTRDELIARTRQLIDEGDRLAAEPLGALQVWLQLSDDLLSTAWGSMDRYHLAWLLVGKPKGTIRGRAMTAEEEAAYVREVAEQKTAALRMSLDAVERQGMPFLGETGGVGHGRTARQAGACRQPIHRSPSAWPTPTRAASPRSISTTTRRAPRAPSACSGDGRAAASRRSAERGRSRAGPDRQGLPAARPAPRPARARADRRVLRAASLKAQVEIEPKRSPAALRDDAASPQTRVAEEIDAPDRRNVARRHSSSRSKRRPPRSPAIRCATRSLVAGIRLRARRHPGRGARRGRQPPRRAAPGDGDLVARVEAWDASSRSPTDRRSAVVDWLIEAVSCTLGRAVRPAAG